MVLLAASELFGSVLCVILLATGKMFTPYLSFYRIFLLSFQRLPPCGVTAFCAVQTPVALIG